MEKTWEKIQQKTFTKWVNSHLRKRAIVIEDLQKAFGDGVNFINFLEIISNQSLPKYEKKPKIRIQKVGNVSTGLQFLKSQKINLVNISAEDIVDENLKLILGLIWTIIQKFQIDDISEEQLSAKEALLLWCQKKTAGYKDCKVENFTWSFQDGLALCALIHRHRPDLLDYNKLSKDNKAYNLQLAFDVAEKELGIPKLLDVEDMVDIKPDERSVITYVVQYYHVFSKYNQAEVAGRRIGKLVDLTTANDAMKNDYLDKARKLVDWINKVKPGIDDRNFENSLDGVKNQIEDFKSYKSNEKPPKTSDKAALDSLFGNIALKLRSNNRPAFDPPAGLKPADIEALWEALAQAEREREQALREELERQQKIDHLKRRFNLKAGKFENWLAEKENYLGTDEAVDSINEAQSKLKTHDAFDDDYANSKPRLETIQNVARDYAALKPTDADAVLAQSDALGSRWTGLAGPQASKRQDLEDKLKRQEKMEALRLEWAKQTKEYKNWNAGTVDNVSNHYFGDNLESVEKFEETINNTDAEYGNNSESKKSDLDKLWDEMQAIGVTENRYTPLTNKDIEASHNHLKEELDKRRAAYNIELERQRNMEAKRKEWAEKADNFVKSLNDRKAAVDAITGEPHDTIQGIKDTWADGKAEHDGLAELASLQEELSGLGIKDNKYTQYTLGGLQNSNQKFVNHVKNLLSALQDEIDMKKEYETKAAALVEWINNTQPSLTDVAFDNTLAGVRNQNSNWQKYLTTERATHDIDRINLTSLYNKISNLLNANNRPAYSPPSGFDQAAIASSWDQLTAQEKEKEAAIKAELSRQEKLATLVKRFNSDAEDLRSWANEKEAFVSAEEEVHDLDTARMKVKFLEVFNSEMASKQPALSELKQLNAEIAALNYKDIDSVNATTAELEAIFARFSDQSASKGAKLQEALSHQQALEELRLSFADQARDFNRWVRDSNEVINDYNFGYTLEEVQAYGAQLDASDAEFSAHANDKKAAIDGVSNDLSSKGVTDNRHTHFNTGDMQNLRSSVDDAIARRRAAYQAELDKQTVHEGKRKEFAQLAGDFINWVDQEKAHFSSLDGTPEERISAVQNRHSGGAHCQDKVAAITTLDKEMKGLGIYDNKHTPYTSNVCESRKAQYDASVANFLQGLQDEKELNERAAAQQAEYERKMKIENLRVAYAKDANALSQWLESANETLSEPILCNFPADVAEFQKEFDAVSAAKDSNNARFDNSCKLANELTDAGGSISGAPTVEDLSAKWNLFQSTHSDRHSALADETARQNHNESLRVSFANQANAFAAWIKEKSAAINNNAGSLEEQLARLQALKTEILSASSQLTAVESSHTALEEAGVTSNPHTDATYPSLKVSYEGLAKEVSNKETVIQREIFQKTNANVSAEQLAEFKEVFEHFDKDRTGTLSRLEFKACLTSLGEDLSDSDIDKIIASIGKEGRVPFDNFCTFMSERAADSDTQDKIVAAFQALSGGNPWVTEGQLRQALPGEKVDYLIANMPLYNGIQGQFDFNAWSGHAFSR